MIKDRLIAADQFGVLQNLMDIIGDPEGIANMLARSLSLVLESLVGSVGGIYLVTDDLLELTAHRGLDGDLSQLRSLTLGSAIFSQREYPGAVDLRFDWLADDPLAQSLRGLGVTAVLLLPLGTSPGLLGYLFAGLPENRELDASEQEFLRTVGRTIGLGIESSRLHSRMDQQLRESRTLYAVSRAYLSTLDLDDLLNLIVRSAVSTIAKADNCVLHFFDEETGELHPKALSYGQLPPTVPGQGHMRIGQGVAGVALATGQVVNVADVSLDPRFVPRGKARSFASMLSVPLGLGKRSIGTLSVDSEQTGAFSADDERLLTILASLTSVAIENSRLVQDLQHSILDLKMTQTKLIQSEKLSAIGQLITGVTHELNNPLTAVMGYSQLLQMNEGVNAEVRRDLNKIYAQAQRAAKIVQNLLLFARQEKAARQFLDVNDVLERTIELRSYQLRVQNIEVIQELDDRLLGVMGDPYRLQQVFLNLIKNAEDAMTDHRGSGRLVISSELAGGTIRCKFTDDGPGISPTVKQHLFEPFFTTKEIGKGTGLGLSICFGIVSQHGGQIEVESRPGEGATFVVELPVAKERPAHGPETVETMVPRIRDKLVLVVDDEEDVASVLHRILSQDGHNVLRAQDGEEALEYLSQARARGTQFDLIISDVKMPGLSGPILYKRICREEPDLAKRIIFVTGDTLNLGTRKFLEEYQLPYIIKPFLIDDVRLALARCLNKSRV